MICLKTERLILRDHTQADLAEYCRLKSDPQTMYYLQDIQIDSFEEGKEDFEKVLADSVSADRRFYFLRMETADTHETVGSVGYTVVSDTPLGKIVHLGYFYYPAYWNRGFMSEAVKKVLEFAFTQNDVYRVTTGCLAENTASERVMQKNGMIKEAEHVNCEWHDGKIKTRVEYRLLKTEWEALTGSNGDRSAHGIQPK